jgi:SRSO17 transposase
LEPCFGRAEPFRQAEKYVAALMSDLPRKNGWAIAELAGDARPDRMQRLLNHAVWDHDEVMAVVRRYVVECLGGQPLRVAPADAVTALKLQHQLPAANRRSGRRAECKKKVHNSRV